MMVKCSECNKLISSESKVCPFCGKPEPYDGLSWLWIGLLVTGCVGLLSVLIAVTGGLPQG